MPARRIAGALAVLAAVTVVAAAFLPHTVVTRVDIWYREVDLRLPTIRWVPPLSAVVVHALLYAAPGLRLLTGGASKLAGGSCSAWLSTMWSALSCRFPRRIGIWIQRSLRGSRWEPVSSP
ncbi:MAG: hypothetical protein ACRDJP_16065 [Actinomycetota bacterium]